MEGAIQTEFADTVSIYKDNNGRPFKTDPNKIVVSTEGTPRDSPQFEKISDSHGRNITEIKTSKGLVWGGELPGDIYGARNIKGTSMEVDGDAAKLVESSHAHSVMGLGLMDDLCIPRIIKSSEFLRKNGLPTEHIRTVKKLLEISVKDDNGNWEKVPIKDWENDQLEKVRSEISYNNVNLDDAKRYLNETDFVAVERDVQVDERLMDLQEVLHYGGFRETIEPIFKWLNVATAARNGGLISGTDRPREFRMTDDDIKRYFVDFLPSQMGVYLGRVHKLGLVHGFPHVQNWSAVGTLYDLDSIYGKPLFTDDPPQTEAGIDEDIKVTLKAIEVLTDKAKYSDELEGINFDRNVDKQASLIFLKEYFTERYGQNVNPGRISEKELQLAKKYGYKF